MLSFRTADDHFFCCLFLPINSPLKEMMVGLVMPTQSLARCVILKGLCHEVHIFFKVFIIRSVRYLWISIDGLKTGFLRRKLNVMLLLVSLYTLL